MDKPHKKLDVWELSMGLVALVYERTGDLPKSEKYALVDQMRRAAISVPSNIAEGAARHTRKEFANFLHIAQGSLSELDTLSELAYRLGLLTAEQLDELSSQMERVDKVLSGLIRRQHGLAETDGRKE